MGWTRNYADRPRPEMLDLASKSGCGGLLLGIESVAPDSVRLMGKGKLNTPHQYYEEIKRLHDAGIAINGCFVFGHDGDDSSVFDRTLEFIDKAAIDLPRFALATPFPNTALYHKLRRQGRLLHEDWSFYDTQHVVFRPARMSPEELPEGHLRVWKEAYRLPMVMKRLLKSGASRSAAVLQHTVPANMAYSLFAKFLPEFALTTCEVAPNFTQVIPTELYQISSQPQEGR